MGNIPENLSRIRSRWRRALVSIILSGFVMAGRIYTAMKRAHPRQLILPAGVAQIVILFISTLFEPVQAISVFAAGLLVVVGLVMLPSTLSLRYHWVAPNLLASPTCHWIQADLDLPFQPLHVGEDRP